LVAPAADTLGERLETRSSPAMKRLERQSAGARHQDEGKAATMQHEDVTVSAYRHARGASGSPLTALAAFAAATAGRSVGAGEIEAFAAELDLPAAAVRGALSFYSDASASAADARRVCEGLSCRIAGAVPAREIANARGVHCLGFCDRSPAVLDARGDVHVGDEARRIVAAPGPPSAAKAVDPPPPPAITSLASRAIVTRRIARGDFSDLGTARADGAYSQLERALRRPPSFVLDEVERSGERGRGGAAFATAVKWRACARAATPDVRYVVANGDEGDPGSYVDRLLLELDPHGVLEGLALAAYASEASGGIVFIRSEYPRAFQVMRRAVVAARAAGVLGPSVLGSSFAFDVEVFPGMGSYVCGEETALLNAIEGRRGEVRLKPPYPATHGLYGRPTVVNNVETLVDVPAILELGADAYRRLGTTDCPGTKALSLNHGFARPGIVEIEFGTRLEEVVAAAGEGPDGAPIEALVLGGPMGCVLPRSRFVARLVYGRESAPDVVLGHGGIIALPRDVDAAALFDSALTFFRDESCGKCVPCKLGARELAARFRKDAASATSPGFSALLEVIEAGSLCAFGSEMPRPLRQWLQLFAPRISRREPE
jgi:NADH:ubiquinone oxidoreductase subunit F (NADH-binding)/NADH:ubiquinone oxidoreductase subunit E